MSPDPGDAYFADGLTEEIITNLSHIGSLRVISRSSAMVLKGTQKDVRTIGRELDVEYVLEGSVRKAGDDLRITAQLIDAENDAHVWAEKYDGVLDDVFAVQETVSHSIAETLRVRLSPEEENQLAERPIPDLQAYELYLKARESILCFDLEKLEAAERDLHQALRIVPKNPLLIIQLAHLHYGFWNTGFRLDENDLRLAREYADEALALDPHSPDHLVIRGLLEVTGGSALRGLAYFEAALERDPTHRDALFWSPAISGFFGRDFEAYGRWAQFQMIDPLHPFIPVMPVWFEIKVGRFAPALELALVAREAYPSDPFVEGVYGLALALNHQPEEAAEVIREAFGPRLDMIARGYKALGCAFENDREGVLELLNQDYQRWAEKDFQYSEWAAQALAQVGESEQALDWLENSVERGNINHPFFSEYDPFLANLRSHSRFAELMKRVKTEWENFEV